MGAGGGEEGIGALGVVGGGVGAAGGNGRGGGPALWEGGPRLGVADLALMAPRVGRERKTELVVVACAPGPVAAGHSSRPETSTTRAERVARSQGRRARQTSIRPLGEFGRRGRIPPHSLPDAVPDAGRARDDARRTLGRDEW